MTVNKVMSITDEQIAELEALASDACQYADSDWFAATDLSAWFANDDAMFISAASPFVMRALISRLRAAEIDAAHDQGEVQGRERWTVMCGHWQDTTLAIHGERTGHIASGIDEGAAHAIVNAHNEGLPPIAAASTEQEVESE